MLQLPSEHGGNSIEGAIVTVSCTTEVTECGGEGKRSAGLWGVSSRFWLGSSDTSFPKLKRFDYPGMELNFILTFHMPLYREMVPTSDKGKKKFKKKWKKKTEKTNK